MSGLRIAEIKKGSAAASFAKRLYEDAFDRRMRIPFDGFFDITGKKKGSLAAAYDEDLFVGFYFVFLHGDSAYVGFLAVVESMRNRGFGTELADIIKDTYSGYRIIVTVEAPKVDDKLVSSSYRRLAFYSRNGFTDTLQKYDSAGITYSVLYRGKEFDPKDGMDPLIRNLRKSAGLRR